MSGRVRRMWDFLEKSLEKIPWLLARGFVNCAAFWLKDDRCIRLLELQRVLRTLCTDPHRVLEFAH